MISRADPAGSARIFCFPTLTTEGSPAVAAANREDHHNSLVRLLNNA